MKTTIVIVLSFLSNVVYSQSWFGVAEVMPPGSGVSNLGIVDLRTHRAISQESPFSSGSYYSEATENLYLKAIAADPSNVAGDERYVTYIYSFSLFDNRYELLEMPEILYLSQDRTQVRRAYLQRENLNVLKFVGQHFMA